MSSTPMNRSISRSRSDTTAVSNSIAYAESSKLIVSIATAKCQATCRVNVHPSTTTKAALEQHLQPDLESISRNFVYNGDVEETTMRLETGENTRTIRAAFLATGAYDVHTTLITTLPGNEPIAAKTRRGGASIKVVL
jgi:hypothetical protein